MTFKKFLTIYSIVLAVLMAAFLGYVADSLFKYENNQLDNYMQNFIDDLKSASSNGDLVIKNEGSLVKSKFEKGSASVRNGLQFLATEDSLTFQESMESKDANHPVYDIYKGDSRLLSVKLRSKDTATRLGLLSFNIWEVEEVTLAKKEGLFDYEITVPSNYVVEVNGKKISEEEYSDKEQFMGFADISKRYDLSFPVKYLIKGLVEKPSVKVTDKSGKEIVCKEKGATLSIEAECQKITDEATAKSKIKNYPDVMKIVETWSLFLSNDLTSEKNGFMTIKEHLIEGTYLYNYAYNWATGPDIKLISKHGFSNPMFTEEKVCNFEIYNDKEFACQVFLQKNMIVNRAQLPDKMGEKVNFVYCDDTDDGENNPQWKIVSMQAVTVK